MKQTWKTSSKWAIYCTIVNYTIHYFKYDKFTPKHLLFRAMVAVFVLLLYLISICTVSGKIHRVHPHFHANFTIIDGSRRLTANCVRNTTVQRIHDCVGECVRDKRCATFNYHRYEGFCELLTLSKFDLEGILERDDNYVHYETDDNESLVSCISTPIPIVPL